MVDGKTKWIIWSWAGTSSAQTGTGTEFYCWLLWLPLVSTLPIISSQNLVTSMPTYLHTSLLTFLYTCLYRRQYCPVTTVTSNRTKSHTTCPLDFHWLPSVHLRFKIYFPGLGGSPLSSATLSYPLPPKNHQADYLLGTYCTNVANFKLYLYFPGGGW